MATGLVLLTVLSLAAAGCTSGPTDPDPSQSASPSAVTLAPAPVSSTGAAAADPAVWAAVRFEQAHCAWDYRQPLAAYVAAQRALATAAYGRELAAETDTASWRQEVVAGRQVVTCDVTDARRLVGAPSTATTVYTRLTASAHITSSMGSFDAGDRLVSLRVELVDGHWLVAGPYTGG